MPAAVSFPESRDYVQSLARGLAVLRAFDARSPAMTLSEVAAASGLARAAARRSLLTLQHLGYLEQRGRQFQLLPMVLELGFAYLGSLQLPELALPWMEALAHRVQESCSLCILDGQDIVYVARVPVRKVVTISLGVGARLPAYAASMGRVLLAGLGAPELEAWTAGLRLKPLTPWTVRTREALLGEIGKVRQQGYAIVQQELEAGLFSIAVPIRSRRGQVVAALNLGTHASPGVEARALREFLPALREAQAAIEDAIAHRWRIQGS